jgi:ATP-binding protein involved in chromosome partitioning
VESRPDALASRAFSAVAQAMLRSLAETGRSGAFDVTWRRMGPKERHEDPPGGAPRASEASPDTPLAVWQVADPLLGILWADGTRTLHGAFELRQACPCAGCIEEWTGRRMESLDAVPREVRPVTIRSVGRYALQPVWSDGHRTGIYTFRDLRLGAGALEER